MKRILLWFSLASCWALGGAQQQANGDLTLDGKLGDPFWQSSPVQRLLPKEPGIPADAGGEVWVGQRGTYICFAARLPEPGGKVLARSMGRNPTWEKDGTRAPDVEDKIVYELRYRSPAGVPRVLTVAINPWGAYRVEENGRVLATAEVLRAVEVTPKGWIVEAAIPETLIDAGSSVARAVDIRAERIRSRRALAPEYRWTWPEGRASSAFQLRPASADAAVRAPEVRSPLLGNSDPPLEIGRVPRVPAAVASREDPAWSTVPEFRLARNEPLPRAPRCATRVKWMHDGRTLGLLVYAEEPEPVVAGPGGRDGAIAGDDNFKVYLATTGSRFLEITVNSAGAVRDALDGGPWLMRPDYSWNGDIKAQTDIRRGRWIARINIPLEQCAAALGESGVPLEWRILIVRYRAPRRGETAESSSLPTLDGTSQFYGPLRYRRMILRDEPPSAVKMPAPAYDRPSPAGLAAAIAGLRSTAWSALERRYLGVQTMVERDADRRVEEATLAERRAWEQVRTRRDWERFRDERMRALRASLGRFPPERPPLDVHVSARHQGQGYRLENLVFQSRPGFYVTANLYLPERLQGPVPGILIVHSQHAPKSEWELQDSGEIWARSGCVVLIMERPGFGERAETNPWYRQAYASRFTFTRQLYLVGENYSAWSAWDVIRSVDFLLQRPEVDPKRVIAIGTVASGGHVAGLAAALDPRITAVVPYNYDQGHLRVHGDLPGQIAGQFSPWLIMASVSPRKFVRPFEFAWEGSEETDIPSLWVDGMSRSEQVWGYYGARDSLTEVQGFGLLRDTHERRSPCRNLGPEQRETLYPILERWFGIPWPSAKGRAILPISELSTNVDRAASRRQEAERLRPDSDLVSIPPALAARLPRKSMHRIAFEMGEAMLRQARDRRRSLDAARRAQQLRDELRPKLGDIEPAPAPGAEVKWQRSLGKVQAQAVVLEVEDRIRVPLLLLLPEAQPARGVVVAVAQGGKDRFLTGRPAELAALVSAGLAVCLPDVRGTGETASSRGENPYGGDPQLQFDLSRNLLGSQLKDLRSVLAYLRSRPDTGGKRIAIWGDSFAPPNPENLYLDEVEYEAGPQVQRVADPLGAHLALLAALYEEDVRAVIARGCLSGYLSILENSYVYVPMGVIVLGILESGDIADIAGALAPRSALLADLVGGRNIRVPMPKLQETFAQARREYQELRAAGRFTVAGNVQNPAAWIIKELE